MDVCTAFREMTVTCEYIPSNYASILNSLHSLSEPNSTQHGIRAESFPISSALWSPSNGPSNWT